MLLYNHNNASPGTGFPLLAFKHVHQAEQQTSLRDTPTKLLPKRMIVSTLASSIASTDEFDCEGSSVHLLVLVCLFKKTRKYSRV